MGILPEKDGGCHELCRKPSAAACRGVFGSSQKQPAPRHAKPLGRLEPLIGDAAANEDFYKAAAGKDFKVQSVKLAYAKRDY